MRSQVELDAIVAALREAHRELRTRLTNRGILRVLAHAGIPRRPARLPVPAMTVIQYGRAAIVIDPERVRNPREETSVLAEEFAHAMLHAGDRGEATIHLSSCGSNDPREFEADYVARCLLAGPGIDVEYRTPPKPRSRPRVASVPWPFAQPYDEQQAPIISRPRREPLYGGQFGESRLARLIRRGKKRAHAVPLPRQPRRFRLGCWEHCDIDGVWWAIHDVSVSFDDAGRVRQREVELGNERARRRYFVRVDDGACRFYQFARWERRAATDSMFDRQLRDSSMYTRRDRERRMAAGE